MGLIMIIFNDSSPTIEDFPINGKIVSSDQTSLSKKKFVDILVLNSQGNRLFTSTDRRACQDILQRDYN